MILLLMVVDVPSLTSDRAVLWRGVISTVNWSIPTEGVKWEVEVWDPVLFCSVLFDQFIDH